MATSRHIRIAGQSAELNYVPRIGEPDAYMEIEVAEPVDLSALAKPDNLALRYAMMALAKEAELPTCVIVLTPMVDGTAGTPVYLAYGEGDGGRVP